jgi:hypothetical protein
VLKESENGTEVRRKSALAANSPTALDRASMKYAETKAGFGRSAQSGAPVARLESRT